MRALNSTLEAVKRQAIFYEQGGFKASLVVFNVALHFLIAERDLLAVKLDALTHPDPWSRNLALRVMLLTMYEWDMDEVTGSALHKALNELNVPGDTIQRATLALRSIRKVRSQIIKNFGDIRNTVIAHRDADALRQYRTIRDIRQNEVLGLVIQFYAGAGEFVAILPDIMLAAGSSSALLKQVLSRKAWHPSWN